MALDWFVVNDPERAGATIFDAWYFWGVRGHYREGLDWANRLEARGVDLTQGTAARLDLTAGFLSWALGDYDTAIARFTAARSILAETGDYRGIATAHFGLGSIYRDQDRSDEAFVELRLALDTFEMLGDRAWMAFCLSVLGAEARQTMRYYEAVELLERGIGVDPSDSLSRWNVASGRSPRRYRPGAR